VARQRQAKAANPPAGGRRRTSRVYGGARDIAAVTAVRREGTPQEPRPATDEGTLMRLSFWLADVSAEAALGSAPESVAN
jgi:hypothetical protein